VPCSRPCSAWYRKPAARGCGCWSPRTRSCAGAATSSAAAGRRGPCAARQVGRLRVGTSGARSSGCPARAPAGGTQDPQRAGRPGSEGSGIDGMGDPEECRDRPRAAPIRAYRVAVPALSGRVDPGVRLLNGRPARRHTRLRPGRDRARDPAHPHRRGDPSSNRGVDRPAGLQPDHGPRRPGAPGQVHDPDRGSNFTAAFDAVLAGARIRTVLRNVRTPG
jgi:hypothetical protein